MSSPRSFEVLLAVSRLLEDDFIDEDISQVDRAGEDQPVTNRTVTVRGKREGTPLVLCYQDLYSTNFNPRAIQTYEANVLEIFVAQPRVTFEGTIAPRGRIGRWLFFFGVGGSKGPHPIFSRLRVDAEGESSPACFDVPGFAGGIEGMLRRPDVLRVQLQAQSGIAAVTKMFPGHATPQQVIGMVDMVRGVAGILG